MGSGKRNSQGFTLIASLLILVLLSGVAAGLLFMVTSESKMAGSDLEANLAYYGAESGMEKLTSDLAALYQSTQSPTTTQIQALGGFTTITSVPNMTYLAGITFPAAGNGVAGMPCTTTATGNGPPTCYNTISSGSNQGLYAELAPMTLNITATRPAGASVNITRTVEVALIPVFQFGVFCGFDCSYFPGPDFSFGGRVHTNQNLFLASGGSLVFNDKVQAFKQVLTDELENGHPTSSGYGGTTYIPNTTGGCPLNTFPPTGANCISLPGAGTIPGDASWSGGYPSVGGSSNPNFPSISSGTFNGYLANSLTGVTNLQLPFVQNSCVSNPPPCTDPISIVRKPQVGESATSTLGSERLYNKASIRILLADTQNDLHPERGPLADGQDIQFPMTTVWSSPGNAPFQNAQVTLTGGGTEYAGFAQTGQNGWVAPVLDAGPTGWPVNSLVALAGELTSQPANPAAMTGPWIRVEYCRNVPCNNPANWIGVTQEWLKLGFSRIFNNPPTAPGSNMVDPNAILILQQLRPQLGFPGTVAAAQALGHGAGTVLNFYPINFYDAREGEMRDNNIPNTVNGNNTFSSCSVNGIMNAVELDVGNLTRWLNGTVAGSGGNVNFTAFNGYVLYFSDHRGMLPSTHPSNGGQTLAGVINGESGIEDVVNSAQVLTSTTTDGSLEGATYYTFSPEDVDQNGFLDNWGEKNIGYGFGINTNTTPPNPYLRINPANTGGINSSDCASYNTATGAYLVNIADQIGMANPVSGARHVLKLVDGGMSVGGVSYLPVMPAASGCVQNAASPTGCGGFTIASENPVYVQGNYNTNGTADTFWTTGVQVPHSAASIIADSVTVLSNQWSDVGSLMFPTVPGNRAPGADAYYRMAVSGGKNIPFPIPGWNGVSQDFGTDGGLHNFLRYLENWGGRNLWYDGSLVSMYYSEYDTGVFKCCTTVYSPPARKYYFDVMFLNPANLPPATPEFQDVVNLSYHQNFTPQ